MSTLIPGANRNAGNFNVFSGNVLKEQGTPDEQSKVTNNYYAGYENQRHTTPLPSRYQNEIQQTRSKENEPNQNYNNVNPTSEFPQGANRDQYNGRYQPNSGNRQIKRGVGNQYNQNFPLQMLNNRPVRFGRNYQKIDFPIKNFRPPVFIQTGKPKSGVRPIIVRPTFGPVNPSGGLPSSGLNFQGPPPPRPGFHGGGRPFARPGPHRRPFQGPGPASDSQLVSGNPFATGARLEIENDISGEGPPSIPQIESNSLGDYDQYNDFQGLDNFSGPESSGDGFDFDYNTSEEGENEYRNDFADKEKGQLEDKDRLKPTSSYKGEKMELSVEDKLVVDPYSAGLEEGSQEDYGFDYNNDDKYKRGNFQEDRYKRRYPPPKPAIRTDQRKVEEMNLDKSTFQSKDMQNEYGNYGPKEPVKSGEADGTLPGFDDLSAEEKKFFASKLTEDEKSFFSESVNDEEKRYFSAGSINDEAKEFFSKFGDEPSERGGMEYGEYEGFEDYGDGFDYGGGGMEGDGMSTFLNKKGKAEAVTGSLYTKNSELMNGSKMQNSMDSESSADSNNWKPVIHNYEG